MSYLSLMLLGLMMTSCSHWHHWLDSSRKPQSVTQLQKEPVKATRSKTVTRSPVGPEKAFLQGELERTVTELGGHRRMVDAYLVALVEKKLEGFKTKHRNAFLRRAFTRFQCYEPLINEIFTRNELSILFKYMVIVESGARTEARSHAHAVGLWQFIAATAKRFGLRPEERRLAKPSTHAAARYLKRLRQDFDPLLAMAAYNMGENGLRRRLRKLKADQARTFQTLHREKMLPKETAQYVPSILAVIVIARNYLVIEKMGPKHF